VGFARQRVGRVNNLTARCDGRELMPPYMGQGRHWRRRTALMMRLEPVGPAMSAGSSCGLLSMNSGPNAYLTSELSWLWSRIDCKNWASETFTEWS